jgi:SpoVK/Ycf46/Vps4 family AAA+-type ATPase
MKTIIVKSFNDNYKFILNFINHKYSEKINEKEYISETNITPYEYIGRNDIKKIRICIPDDCAFDINYNNEIINFKLKTELDTNGNIIKIQKPAGGCGSSSIEDVIYKNLKLSSEEEETLIDFINEAKEYSEKLLNESKMLEIKTISINIWRKEYWNMLFKSPKRPIETLYLKEGQKEDLMKNVEEFYDNKTRGEYLFHGIPYKSVFMLYGPPGTGKTSTINTIASHFDCDVYVIPVSKELTDYGLIDAMGFLKEKEEKKRIIVIEDIDSIFTDRKRGDDDNGITLQGLLNCFDGFSCVEGTLLFITANKPEVIDEALIRSCRVDHKYELDYANEYQTKCIFERMAPEKDKSSFKKFYKFVRNRTYTTAMLQEFLFFNRKKDTIYDIIDKFYEIINKNSLLSDKKDSLYV